jgi:hypothetical protein
LRDGFSSDAEAQAFIASPECALIIERLLNPTTIMHIEEVVHSAGTSIIFTKSEPMPPGTTFTIKDE